MKEGNVKLAPGVTAMPVKVPVLDHLETTEVVEESVIVVQDSPPAPKPLSPPINAPIASQEIQVKEAPPSPKKFTVPLPPTRTRSISPPPTLAKKHKVSKKKKKKRKSESSEDEWVEAPAPSAHLYRPKASDLI